jgi:hypothetical protein
MVVERQNAVVYMAPTRGRRFLTLEGALRAEARARLDNEYCFEGTCSDEGRPETPAEHWITFEDDIGGEWSQETKDLYTEKLAEVRAEYKEHEEWLKNS